MKKRKIEDKKEDINKNWTWVNIVSSLSNLATFLALIFSVYQNYVSDKRYEENERDSKINLKTIRERDSIQIKFQIAQTEALIEELKLQKKESERIRKRDFAQLDLYNKQIKLLNESVVAQIHQLDVQNKSLEVQKTLYKPDFNIEIDFHPIKEVSSNLHIMPIILLKNTGSSIAYDVNVDYMLIALDTETRRIINALHSYQKRDMTFKINEEKKLEQSLPFIAPLDFAFSEDSVTSQDSKELYLRKYFIVVHITYKDKYSQKNTIYLLNEIHHSINVLGLSLELQKMFLPITLHVSPFMFEDLPALKNTFLKNNIDYKTIYGIYKTRSSERATTVIK